MSIHEQAQAYAAGIIMGGSDFARDVRKQVRDAYLAGHEAATRTRVVATVTELDALPVGSVVIALAGGASWQKMPDGLWAGVLGTRDSRGIRERGYLPARVLYDPEEAQTTTADPDAYRPVERFGAEGGRLLPARTGSVDTHTDTPGEDT